ncbi:MAG: DnaJ domain-containing protein [Desulfosarcinaceae bacterium]|nr:DnaJ domain-containing protein [Desulfosarcinaceae bacterium]
MSDNYYLILGVPRSASAAKIKRAYRDLAKRYHPDHAGVQQNGRRFRLIQEAYDTLRHGERRAAYDDQLRRAQIPPSPQHYPPKEQQLQETAASSQNLADPLTPYSAHIQHRSQAQSVSPLQFEVILEPVEALRGGHYPMRIPLMTPCTRCGASGQILAFACPRCRGNGHLRENREVLIQLPPNLADGRRVILPLDDIGQPGVALHLEIRIASTSSF